MNLPRIHDVTNANQARDLAIEYSTSTREDYSWGEIAEHQEYFSTLANRFPELREEFEENAII